MKTATPENNLSALPLLLKEGWKVVSDGPSGVQLERKKWKMQSKGAVIVGAILLILFWPIGLLLIILGALDGAMTKPEVKFLPRG